MGNRESETPDGLSRRDWLKVVGVAGVASVASGAAEAASAVTSAIPPNVAAETQTAEVLPLTSTSDVFESSVSMP